MNVAAAAARRPAQLLSQESVTGSSIQSSLISSPVSPLYRRGASCLQLWALLSSEPLSVAFGCPPAVCLASDLVKPQLVYR